MKKIVYCNPSLCNPDGIERVLIGKANYFADVMEYDVTIVLTDGEGLPLPYNLSPRVHVQQLNIGFYQAKAKTRLGLLWIYRKKIQQYRKQLTALLMQLKPDVTVTLLRRELNFLCNIKDGSRKIGELHLNRQHIRQVDFGPYRLRSWLTKCWMKLFIRQVRKLDTFVVLTKEDAAQWSELQNVVVIPNKLSFLSDEVSTLQHKTVVAVGRYAWQKGFDRLIRIWSKVASSHPDWQLCIYGRGDRKPYQQIVDALGLQNSVHLYPYTNYVQGVYLQSSIFALTSRYEGFGLVLSEAMQMGLPCVSFACPCGPKDIITEGVDGFLIPNNDESSFAEKLSLLMDDEPLRKRLGNAARSSSFRYEEKQVMQQWMQVFE